MALGGLVVIAMLVVAAVYLPGWYRARAGGSTAVVVDVQKPPADATAQPPADTTAQPSADTMAQPPADTTAQPPVQTSTTTPAGGASRSVGSGSRPTSRLSPKDISATPGGQPAVITERNPVPPPQPPPNVGGAVVPPAVDEAALDRARERLGLLGARVNAVRGTLQNLEQQQRSQGVGLRTDISASWKRMEFLMDEAEAALKRQDLKAAKRNLDNAERETDKLEQFLGR